MPRVRILDSVSGTDVNYVRGDEVDLPGPTAASWCAEGLAELVRDAEPETPERSEAAESTKKPAGRGDRRGRGRAQSED